MARVAVFYGYDGGMNSPAGAFLVMLIVAVIYLALLIATVIFVQAVVRISHAMVAISRSMDEIAGAMRSGRLPAGPTTGG
jgi:hypothetical protein